MAPVSIFFVLLLSWWSLIAIRYYILSPTIYFYLKNVRFVKLPECLKAPKYLITLTLKKLLIYTKAFFDHTTKTKNHTFSDFHIVSYAYNSGLST